jgi:hypothetical protein
MGGSLEISLDNVGRPQLKTKHKNKNKLGVMVHACNSSTPIVSLSPVWVCRDPVRERERDRARQGDRERERETERFTGKFSK